MFGIIKKLFGTLFRAYTWLALAALLALGYLGFLHFGPDVSTRIGSHAQSVVTGAIESVVESLPDPDTPRTLLVLPMTGDRADDYFRGELAQGILDSGKFQTIDKTFTEKALAMVNLQWGDNEGFTDEQARSIARRANADAVIVGSLEKFKTSDPAEIALEWTVLDADKTIEAAQQYTLVADSVRISPDTETNGAASMTGFRPVGPGWALVIWVGVTLAFPLFLGGVLMNFLNKESNLANLGLLAVLTLINVALAIALMGFSVNGVLDSAIVLTAFALGGVYNYLLLDKLESLRQ